jgi:hypothetical protein
MIRAACSAATSAVGGRKEAVGRKGIQMRKAFAVAALNILAVGCAQHSAPPSATSNTTATTAASSAAPAAAPVPGDLTGASVTLSANYPTQDVVFTNVVNGTVPVHWSEGALHSVTGRLVQVNAEFDVAPTQVTETFLMNARLGKGTFNGPVYKFQGAPKIAKVTFNPLQSDPSVAPTGISFTDDSISVNDSGVNVTNGAKQVLDVTFAH